MPEWCPPVAAEGRTVANPCKGWGGCTRADVEAWLATIELGRAWAIQAAQGPVSPAQGIALLQWTNEAGALAGAYKGDGGLYLNPWIWAPTVQKLAVQLTALCALIDKLEASNTTLPPVPDAIDEFRTEIQNQKTKSAREWAVPLAVALGTSAIIGLIVWRVTTKPTTRKR